MKGRPGPGGGGGTALVIFGASGDLSTRRLIPALRNMTARGEAPSRLLVVGVDRRLPAEAAPIGGFAFVKGDVTRAETFRSILEALRRAGGARNTLYYLATGPELFGAIVGGVGASGRRVGGWRRIVVEKPFGVDLGSARALEARLKGAFRKEEIFRMDHFLGKDGTLEMTRRRFAAPDADSTWSNGSVDHVQIMADEDTGVLGRGDFFDRVGAGRDMVQNHLLQLLCLVAMERPKAFDWAGVGRAKAEVLRAMRPPRPGDVVWGQYGGYARVEGVRAGSRTPTFVALRTHIDNPRWRGVPFYLRTGRLLARNVTEVVVAYKPGKKSGGGVPLPRYVRFPIDPPPAAVRRRTDEYERLIGEALTGDRTHFVDGVFNELAWRLLDPAIEGWEKSERGPDAYEPGSWGPGGSDALLADDGRRWIDGREGGPA